MEFCDICKNMMYIVQDGPEATPTTTTVTGLVYRCRNCQYVKACDKKTKIISMMNFADDELIYRQFLNNNLKYDPTLPHVDNIPCKNAECTKKPHEPNDVIFIKYDNKNMRFLYTCCYCQAHWR